MNIHFAFIVLHYNQKTISDTKACIDSILSLNPAENTRICVVENGSGDESAQKLEEIYHDNHRVHIEISDKNLGFAGGNNLGCSYAQKEWTPSFLIVLNNDTVIEQADFLDVILTLHGQYHYAVLGPDIRDLNNYPQNPVAEYPITSEEVSRQIDAYSGKLQQLKKSYLKYYVKFKLKKEIRRLFKRILLKTCFAGHIRKKSRIYQLSRNPQLDIGLHGAAYVFSKEYFDLFDSVFYPGTFMFKEEDIIFYRVKKYNLISLYHPALRIIHKEDASTVHTFRSSSLRELFIVENQLKSLIAFRDYIDSGNHS